MDQIEKLDTILTILVKTEKLRPYAPESDIVFAVYENHTTSIIPPPDVIKVLEKLENDGFVKQKMFHEPKYYTTINGELFNYAGGYAAKYASLDEEKRKSDSDTLQSLRNGRRLNWLTFVLCLCTGGLVFYQVWHDTNPLWSISLWAALYLFCTGILVGLCIWLIIQELLRKVK